MLDVLGTTMLLAAAAEAATPSAPSLDFNTLLGLGLIAFVAISRRLSRNL